jgi:cytochrome c oxidase assembly factor CtaG
MTWALLLSWDLRVEIILLLAIAATLYLWGWRRLGARVDQGRAAQPVDGTVPRTNPRPPLLVWWRPVAYLAGLLVVAVALMSPIDVLSSQLFFMHMIQHLMLMMVAAPLLLLASPYAISIWGLPKAGRQTIARVLNGQTTLRRVVTTLTAPGIVWIVYFIVYVGWHDRNMYELALRNPLAHDVEHVTFFAVALLVWWHITGVAPRFHRTLNTTQRLIFVVSLVPISMFTGIAIAFASQPIYPFYEAVPRLYGISVMDDQILSGVIMWIPGGMMFFLAGLVLISRIVQTEVDKPIDPNPPWLVDENTVARRP